MLLIGKIILRTHSFLRFRSAVSRYSVASQKNKKTKQDPALTQCWRRRTESSGPDMFSRPGTHCMTNVMSGSQTPRLCSRELSNCSSITCVSGNSPCDSSELDLWMQKDAEMTEQPEGVWREKRRRRTLIKKPSKMIGLVDKTSGSWFDMSVSHTGTSRQTDSSPATAPRGRGEHGCSRSRRRRANDNVTNRSTVRETDEITAEEMGALSLSALFLSYCDCLSSHSVLFILIRRALQLHRGARVCPQ